VILEINVISECTVSDEPANHPIADYHARETIRYWHEEGGRSDVSRPVSWGLHGTSNSAAENAVSIRK